MPFLAPIADFILTASAGPGRTILPVKEPLRESYAMLLGLDVPNRQNPSNPP